MSRHDLFGPPDIIGGRQVGDQCLFLLYIVIYYFKSTSLCFDFGIVFDDICPSCLEYLKNILQDFINDFGCIVVLQKRQ